MEKTTVQQNLIKLVMCGLLAAMTVVIGTVCKLYFTFGSIRITFENLTVLLSGILFGPVAGGLVGACADLITCVTSSQPSINPLITLGAASVGFFAGLMSRLFKNARGILRLLPCVFIPHVIGNLIIKNIALYLMGFHPYSLLLRIPTYLGIAVFECLLLYFIVKNKEIRKLSNYQL
ncbi:MAG: folate family ECF transporter S component [Clostridiales bacterium]|nr:folate family ECF transporter S component [Clostridiales bacterium]